MNKVSLPWSYIFLNLCSIAYFLPHGTVSLLTFGLFCGWRYLIRATSHARFPFQITLVVSHQRVRSKLKCIYLFFLHFNTFFAYIFAFSISFSNFPNIPLCYFTTCTFFQKVFLLCVGLPSVLRFNGISFWQRGNFKRWEFYASFPFFWSLRI